jgi:lantibiotic modifying enzyme
LLHAKRSINYVISHYKGKENFIAKTKYLEGAEIGFLNGPAGGAYAASKLYDITGDEKYKDFAIKVTNDLVDSAHEEEVGLTWYGFYGILGEGGLILYLLDVYKRYGVENYLNIAKKAATYVANQKENAPNGGYRWYVMDTESFPTIGKAGGYFPGFEYGAAGSGYIMATAYEYTKDEEFLSIAKGAADYIEGLAVYSEDKDAALIPYNDTYLKDLFYLGVCQGPIGTSRLFFKLYEITGEEKYKDFVIKLTNGILATGAPQKHSEGYWRTNCYCCGAAGMVEHFINIHKLTNEDIYLKAAKEAAETLIGESTYDDKKHYTNWYTAWNRHEPWTSDAYTGLYHGSTGCAASLIALAQ